MRTFLTRVDIAALIVLMALIAIRSRKDSGGHPSAMHTGGSAAFHSSRPAGSSFRAPTTPGARERPSGGLSEGCRQ